jgi:hypothetical protein
MGVARRRVARCQGRDHRTAGTTDRPAKLQAQRTGGGADDAQRSTERPSAAVPEMRPPRMVTVEERLRVCFTLVDAVYHVNELAGEYDIIRVDEFAPGEVQDHIPPLMCALRGQLTSIKAALPFECMSRHAPDVTERAGHR